MAGRRLFQPRFTVLLNDSQLWALFSSGKWNMVRRFGMETFHLAHQLPASYFILIYFFAFICIYILSCHEVCLGWSDLFYMVASCTQTHTHTERHPWTDKEKKTKKMFTYWQKLSFCSNDSELQGVYSKRPLKFGVKIGFLAGTLMGRLMALLLKASSPNPNCLRFDQLLSWHDPNPSCRLMKTPFGRLAMLPPPLTKRGSVLGGIAKHLSRVPK